MRLTTLSALVLVFAATLLSACTAPQPSTTEMLILEKDSVTTTQEKIPMQSPTDTTLKTAADFEHIDAQFVTLTTSKGPITFEIFADKVPVTAQNFLNLAKSGFYDGIVFHRVIADFMAQAGDPLTKDPSQQSAWGTGGPGYTIPDEFMAELTHDGPGVVSMANVGRPNTGGSQFFITFEATPWLDGKHTVFGKVTEGLDVLKQITQGDTIVSVTYQ